MMRRVVSGASALAGRCCPLPGIFRTLENAESEDDKKLVTRLNGMSFLFTMIWVGTQMAVYVFLFIIFLMSEKNPFMQEEDCCTANVLLSRTNNDLPLSTCPTESCMLYNFEWTGGSYSINDERPRVPDDGSFSAMFSHNGQTWCCNLHASDTECCNKLPWGWQCAAVMWMCGFASICSMVMSQVVLQGFYSFTARRKAWMVMFSTFLGILLRLIMFQIMYHTFFAFCFVFIHFWYPMIHCDNPYAFLWWSFGYEYIAHFFSNLGWIATHGFTEFGGYFGLDAFISTHATMCFAVDFLFALIYTIMSKIKDKQHRPYLHLVFFKL